MFIYSVRASTLRFFAVIILTIAMLLGIVLFARNEATAYTAATGVDFSGIKTNEDRLAFISKFVSGVSGEPCETISFSVPENFDRIMLAYNEIQKSQGLDITKYKNKKVTRYTPRLPILPFTAVYIGRLISSVPKGRTLSLNFSAVTE